MGSGSASMGSWEVGAAWSTWSSFTTQCSCLVDEGKTVDVFYLGISNIFDTVSHGILQKKLSLPAHVLDCKSKAEIDKIYFKNIPQSFARKKTQKTPNPSPQGFRLSYFSSFGTDGFFNKQITTTTTN